MHTKRYMSLFKIWVIGRKILSKIFDVQEFLYIDIQTSLFYTRENFIYKLQCQSFLLPCLRQMFMCVSQGSMLVPTLLNGRAQSMVGNKIAEFKVKICHGWSIMATFQPFSKGLCFICITIRCIIYIYFLWLCSGRTPSVKFFPRITLTFLTFFFFLIFSSSCHLCFH